VTGPGPGVADDLVTGPGPGVADDLVTGPGPGVADDLVTGSESAAVGRIRASYVELTGGVPASIETRLTLAERAGRIRAVEAIESVRDELIMANPLGRKTGQLVQFGQLVALGREGPARLHAGAAHRAGASVEELVGVAELALITAGMPAYSLGVEIVADLVARDAGGSPPAGTGER
jgi:4-carboxymuconolactone decarboxylase